MVNPLVVLILAGAAGLILLNAQDNKAKKEAETPPAPPGPELEPASSVLDAYEQVLSNPFQFSREELEDIAEGMRALGHSPEAEALEDLIAGLTFDESGMPVPDDIVERSPGLPPIA